jgi:hypothetical protein
VSDAGDGGLFWELLFEFAGVEAAVRVFRFGKKQRPSGL